MARSGTTSCSWGGPSSTLWRLFFFVIAETHSNGFFLFLGSSSFLGGLHNRLVVLFRTGLLCLIWFNNGSRSGVVRRGDRGFAAAAVVNSQLLRLLSAFAGLFSFAEPAFSRFSATGSRHGAVLNG